MVFFDLIEVTINPNHPQYELISSALNVLQALYNYSLSYQLPSEKNKQYPLFEKLSNLIYNSRQLHSNIQLRLLSTTTTPEQQEGWDPSTKTITIQEISSPIQLISKLINFLHYSSQPWLNDPGELAKILAQVDSLSYFKLSLKIAYYYYYHLPQQQTLKEIKLNLPLVLNEMQEKDRNAILNIPWETFTEDPLKIEHFLESTDIPEQLIERAAKQKEGAESPQYIYSKEVLSSEIVDVLHKTDMFLAQQHQKEEKLPKAKRLKLGM